ncbi:MAG: hypothetical protein JWO36_4687 [Myxococcales bacterium]|nr:hypothetical protein [Myxococcales bacterium]
MAMKRLFTIASALAVTATIGATTHLGYASDHDDGETDLKSRALNLSDHFSFKSGTDLALVMYFNPRSLPGRQYTMSTNARYEFHVSKATSRTATPTLADDYVFRFEAAAPDATGAQAITLTVLKAGAVVGTSTGTSTTFAASKADAVHTNTGTAGGIGLKYFIGQRADSFHFDVVRYFQVRAFLAARFFGGAGGIGDATASLAPNCRGDAFLGGVLGNTETNPDADGVNLFNPPSCAPDFTKNLNVTAIVLNVPIADLGGGAIFDTWSTISVKQ